jgi:hypothetical protein
MAPAAEALSPSTWADLLDELERGADACEQHFVDGEGDRPPELTDAPALLDAAPRLGPLPEHLASRARSVLRRIDTVNARLGRIPRPTQDAGRTHFAGAASTRPAHLDRAL